MDKWIVELIGVSYSYPDGTRALNAINLKVRQGKISALLGGNGAGKSTLLLILNAILRPSAGSFLFDGAIVAYGARRIRELHKDVGIVFQDPDTQLFSGSVFQDISFGAVNMLLAKEEVAKRVERVMFRLGISHLKDKPTHCLSHGEKKRVALAGVLVMEPKLLVLDEPTAGLDPLGTSQIIQLIKETQKDLGISVIISTHDMDSVPLFCDEVHVMKQGAILASGTLSKVFADAELMRSANLRLPRIAHLFEILRKQDGFDTMASAFSIGEARTALKNWRDQLEASWKQ